MGAKLARKGDFFSSKIPPGTVCSSITLDSYCPTPLVEARRKDKVLDISAKCVEYLSGKPMRKGIKVRTMHVCMVEYTHWLPRTQTIHLSYWDDSSKAVHELVHAQLKHSGQGFVKRAYREGLATFAMDVFDGHTQYFWLIFDKLDYIPFTRALHLLSKALGDQALAFQIAAAKAPETFWQMIFPLKFYKEEIAAAKEKMGEEAAGAHLRPAR